VSEYDSVSWGFISILYRIVVEKVSKNYQSNHNDNINKNNNIIIIIILSAQ